MSASREKRDVYYRLAKTIGVRARSAFKLAQLQKTCGILDGIDTILDLCAAPGGWSALCQELTSYRCSSTQISTDELNVDEQNESAMTSYDVPPKLNLPTTKTIIAVDCVSIAPIPGVTIIKGDITRPSTASDILDAAKGQKVDIVLFDGAPDVTGQLDFDESAQHALILAGASLCLSVLREDGVFVAKMFRGAQTAKTCSILAKYVSVYRVTRFKFYLALPHLFIFFYLTLFQPLPIFTSFTSFPSAYSRKLS